VELQRRVEQNANVTVEIYDLLKTMNGTLTEHTALLDGLADQVGGLKHQVGGLRDQVGELKDQVGELKDQVGELKAQSGEILGILKQR
jgi:regulator of replication initiation timing